MTDRSNAPAGEMTIREKFAAMALIGMGGWCPLTDEGGYPDDLQAAKAAWAVGMADALLSALSPDTGKGE